MCVLPLYGFVCLDHFILMTILILDCLFLVKVKYLVAICSYLPSITAKYVTKIISGRLVVDDDDDDVDNFDVRVSHTTLWHALVMTISINYAMAIQGLSMFSLFSRHRPKMWLLYEFDYFPASFPPDNRHIAPWCTENLDADQMRPDRESRDFADFYQNKPLLGLCIFTRRHIKNVRQDRYTNDIECEKPVDIKREKPK